MITQRSVLPPPGGLGGFLVLGFRGSVPARALGGGVSGGVLAGFSSETPVRTGPFRRETPVTIGPFSGETPVTIGPFCSETPVRTGPFAAAIASSSTSATYSGPRRSGRTVARRGRALGTAGRRRRGALTGGAAIASAARTCQRLSRPRPPPSST